MKTGELKSTVCRVEWSRKIDHSLVTLALPLFGKNRCLPPVVRIKSNVKRFRIPGGLLRRAVFLTGISAKHDDMLRAGVTDSVPESWVSVRSALQQEPPMLIETVEAMAAAKVNAPQDYWSRLTVLQYDNGAPAGVSAVCMLNCVRRRGVVTDDPAKTARAILEHRREMAQVPDVLPMSEDLVYEALRDVSQ